MLLPVELRQVQYFVVVARQRSFSRAAEAIGVAQPALSQQMKRLEQELGVELLDRSSRPVTLTEAGVAFLARAERMLAEANLAREEMREFAGVGSGRVVFGVLTSLARRWLPPLLARFQQTHPSIGLVLREETTEELLRLLGLGELDLALLHAVPGLYTGDSAHRGIVMERLFDEDLVLITAVDHHLATRRSVDLRSLRDEAWVMRARASGLAHTVTTSTAAEGFTPVVTVECSTASTVRSLVSAGLGISVVPRQAAEVAGPPVAVLRLRPPMPTHPVTVAWRSDARPSAATEALLALVRGRGPAATG